jgi:4-carboxymuconolactone decarboxylase
MRLPLMEPSGLTAEQKPLYDDMKTGIETNFKGFQAVNPDGVLIGPWNPWLHFPKMGGPVWDLVKAMSTSPTLPKPVREVAILVTGAKFNAAYEIYAHVLVAELRGLDDDTISTIVADQRPANLSGDEGVAYDVASALVNGGVLPTLVYNKAIEHFGAYGAAELIYLVGLYCMVSTTLNGFDVPVPEEVAPQK